MTVYAGFRVQLGTAQRLHILDRARGFAIALMVGDHLAQFWHPWGDMYRVSLGRVAMPLFFLIAGSLIGRRRPGWRVAWIAVLGLVVPVIAPWIDQPNVLLLYAWGRVAVWVCEWLEVPVWVVPVMALTLYANGWGGNPSGFAEAAPVALLVVGRMVGRGQLAALLEQLSGRGRVARALEGVGRCPLTWYVGHLAVLGVATGVLR